MLDMGFYKNKKVLITGHTGFKGSWMCQMLIMAGADLTGYALEPQAAPNLFTMCHIGEHMNSIVGDIRDLSHMQEVFAAVQPEIVIHMAAQPLVRESYRAPVYTYETNVMGTVNVLECVRLTPSVKSFLNVTTDKVYLNKEWEWGYRENEELNGYDPYSNSKSCSELVTSSYLNSFFRDKDVAISTARAGNVIGGGDFAIDRIIPDCIRAAAKKENIIVRNPLSTRPYEHVLEPVSVYLMIAKEQYENKKYAGNYNVGPDESDCWTTGKLVTLFCDKWNRITGENIKWVNQDYGGSHEANFLKLDCSKLKKTFNWSPCWNVETAMEKVVEWYSVYRAKGDVLSCMQKQIEEFYRLSCRSSNKSVLLQKE
ncbi:MAG: CDP-glucose 4,6-dehydratase [Blautia sp.]|nr:CDP-glucose 4,6-dehydratase [Lachnoclostridium sp.]MCM1212185.1 CDP-glucose 4,6-dehydratase [Blautia sp.]